MICAYCEKEKNDCRMVGEDEDNKVPMCKECLDDYRKVMNSNPISMTMYGGQIFFG